MPSFPFIIEHRPKGLRLIATLKGHTDSITAFEWSPDGRCLATPSRDHTCRVWDVVDDEGAVQTPLKPVIIDLPKEGFACAWDPTTPRLAVTYGAGVAFWQSEDEETRLVPAPNVGVWCLHFTATGEFITGFDQDITWWAEGLDHIESSRPTGHALCLGRGMTPYGAGSLLALTNSSLMVVDIDGRRLGNPLPDSQGLRSIAVHPESREILGWTQSGESRRWIQTESGFSRAASPELTLDNPVAVSYSLQGEIWAVKDRRGVHLWTTDSSVYLATLDERDSSGDNLHSALFNPRFPLLATLTPDGKSVRLWEVDSAALRSAYDRSELVSEEKGDGGPSQELPVSPEHPAEGQDEVSLRFPYDALISHSSKDKEWVRTLVHRLEADGCRIWFDEKDISWGESIRRAVRDGIDQSRHLIVALTPHAVGSEWVELEALIASWEDPANRRKTLLPLLLDECEIPRDVRHLKYLDVTSPAKLEAEYPKILQTLLNSRGEEDVPPEDENPPVKPASTKGADRALVIDLHPKPLLALPSEIAGEELQLQTITRVPSQHDPELCERLRAADVDQAAWQSIWPLIMQGVEAALTDLQGTLHVFFQGPYPVAFYLGRCLDHAQRGASILVHQMHVEAGQWVPLSGDHPGVGPSRMPWLPFKTIRESTQGGDGIVLSLELLHPAQLPPGGELTGLNGLIAYRRPHSVIQMRPEHHPTFLNTPSECAETTRQVLRQLGKARAARDVPWLMLAISGPAAWAIELGMRLSPTAWPHVILTDYFQGTYLPVVELHGMSARPAEREVRRVDPVYEGADSDSTQSAKTAGVSRWLIASLTLCLILTAAAAWYFFSQPDLFVLDTPPPRHPLTIVTVAKEAVPGPHPSEADITAYRAHLGRLLSTLVTAGPRAIAMDIAFDRRNSSAKPVELVSALKEARAEGIYTVAISPVEDQGEHAGAYTSANRDQSHPDEPTGDPVIGECPGGTVDPTDPPCFSLLADGHLLEPVSDGQPYRALKSCWGGRPSLALALAWLLADDLEAHSKDTCSQLRFGLRWHDELHPFDWWTQSKQLPWTLLEEEKLSSRDSSAWPPASLTNAVVLIAEPLSHVDIYTIEDARSGRTREQVPGPVIHAEAAINLLMLQSESLP